MKPEFEDYGFNQMCLRDNATLKEGTFICSVSDDEYRLLLKYMKPDNMQADFYIELRSVKTQKVLHLEKLQTLPETLAELKISLINTFLYQKFIKNRANH